MGPATSVDRHVQRTEKFNAASTQHLAEAIEHAAHYLPAQGPISVFIHHNTLHAFEHLPFDVGVQEGGRLYGCQPYLLEERYREFVASGRIRREDLSAALLDDLGERADQLLGFLGTRFHFRLAMLQYPLRVAPLAELRWFVAEADALQRVRSPVAPQVRERLLRETRRWVLRDLVPSANGSTGDRRGHQVLDELIARFGLASVERWSERTWEAFTLQALWRICRNGVHGVRHAPPSAAPVVRHRTLLLKATGEDSDLLVHEFLIPLCAAFLDQGFASWNLPERDRGLLAAARAVYGGGTGPARWLRPLAAELARLERMNMTPLESIAESLQLLGVEEKECEEFLTATLLALPGWAGMVRQVELRADSVVRTIPAGSLVELVALRLILERLALAHVAAETLDYRGPLDELRRVCRAHFKRPESSSVDQRAFQVFHLAQVLGWLPGELLHLSKRDWTTLVEEIEAFGEIERRKVFHAAYERRYRIATLDAFAIRARSEPIEVRQPRMQVVCCLDEREESFRRHIEEVEPQAETFSTAGFYAAAIYYRGAGDAHFVPLCPVVIRPQHWVVEEVVAQLQQAHRRRAESRRALASASHQVHVGSRSLLGGALVAAGMGALASIPLVARVLFPRWTAQIRHLASGLVRPPPATELIIERSEQAAGPQPGQIGFTVDEMADIVERVLRELGLTRRFARLVFVCGHGSSSLNNPHESAHDCGACGGGRGGPNARAFARMANDPRVRRMLAQRGIDLPDDTVFVGAYHNTCDESLTCFDEDRLPDSHRADMAAARLVFDEARRRDAHERCRRFESAPLSLTTDAALKHVEARAEDLAQVRPEYGHATNAVCFVGRRSRTRGLFLDRRTFLTSYDPTQDDANHTILMRILQAAVPVCAGISLEYYFSFVDPTGYGCGTKLPHNVTSLLGVMDGAASDLRTGLPWQMVEVHEPMRLLFVIETTPQVMLQIMDRNETIGRLCTNGWVQLATLSPDSAAIHHFHGGRFESYACESTSLPRVASSIDWYRGWRDHLGYAIIDPSVAR